MDFTKMWFRSSTETLAKRLVCQNSASDGDAEVHMISKLKQAVTLSILSKLQRMFQDIGVSKALNAQFKKHLMDSEPLDFRFQYSRSELWMVALEESCTVLLPSELEPCYQRSQHFMPVITVTESCHGHINCLKEN